MNYLTYIIIVPIILVLSFFLNALLQYFILYLYGAENHFSWMTACGIYAFLFLIGIIKTLKALVRE